MLRFSERSETQQVRESFVRVGGSELGRQPQPDHPG